MSIHSSAMSRHQHLQLVLAIHLAVGVPRHGGHVGDAGGQRDDARRVGVHLEHLRLVGEEGEGELEVNPEGTGGLQRARGAHQHHHPRQPLHPEAVQKAPQLLRAQLGHVSGEGVPELVPGEQRDGLVDGQVDGCAPQRLGAAVGGVRRHVEAARARRLRLHREERLPVHHLEGASDLHLHVVQVALHRERVVRGLVQRLAARAEHLHERVLALADAHALVLHGHLDGA
eukprot:5185624-Pyramimonas_sp.AAC.2